MRWLWFALAVAAIGCSKPAGNPCGGGACTADQRCTATQVCVTDTPPKLTVTAPLERAAVSVNSVQLEGTASDDVSVAAVEYSIDGTTWTKVTLGSEGGFKVTVALPDLDSANLTLTVRARDSLGREVKDGRTLKVDNRPPTCAILAPADGAELAVVGGLTVTLSASDGSSQLLNAQLSTDGAANFAAVVSTASGYSFDWTFGAENGAVRELVFRVEDGSGHPCEAKVTVTLDNVVPTVSFASPDAGSLLGPAFFTAGGVVAGVASDGVRALKSVTLELADGGAPQVATLTDGGWSATISAPAADDFTAHTLIVLATDLVGNTAAASMPVTVDVKPPTLAITAPPMNAKFNALTVGDGSVMLTWTMSDGDPVARVGLVLPDGGLRFTLPLSVGTSPTDNPTTYSPSLVASDTAGNRTAASTSFQVDRAAPTVASSIPPNNTRMWAGPLVAVNFTEPVTGDAGLQLPGFSGGWASPTRYQIPATGLQKNAVYTATGGAVVDAFGNPASAFNIRFHTETWKPDSGTTLVTGYNDLLGAVADQDGTIFLLAVAGSTVNWHLLDEVTGNPILLSAHPGAQVANALVAWRTVQPNLSARRVAGFHLKDFAGTDFVFMQDGFPVTFIINALAFIPMPAFPGEGTGLGAWAYIDPTGSYLRGGAAAFSAGLASINEVNVSSNRWEIASHSDGGTLSRSYGCYPSPISGAPDSCTLTGLRVLGGSSSWQPSSAISSRCSVHAYATNGFTSTTAFKWQPDCGGLVACVADVTVAAARPNLTADPNNDGTFYSLKEVAAGQFQLSKLVTDPFGCGGTWSDLGALLSLTTTSAPRVVVLRGVPSVIYADSSTNEVKFVTP